MARFLNWTPTSDYAQQWAIVFGVGCFSWFILICFAQILPASIQLLSFLVPILCFVHALHILPKWQRQGKRDDLIHSLSERESAHALMNRHHFNLAAMDIDHDRQMKELASLYSDDEESPPYGATPHAQLAPPEQANYLLRVKQEVMQACGDIGWLCVEYLSAQGSQYCDKDGWIAIEKLRGNWSKKYGLNTEQLRHLLTALTNIQIGEWRDSSLKDWRLLLTV